MNKTIAVSCLESVSTPAKGSYLNHKDSDISITESSGVFTPQARQAMGEGMADPTQISSPLPMDRRMVPQKGFSGPHDD